MEKDKDFHMEKAALRRSMKKRRAEISDRAYQQAEVCRRIAAHPFYAEAKRIFVYLACGTELALTPLIQRAEEDGRILAAPRVTGPHRMEFRILRKDEPLVKSAFGIDEPGDTALTVEPEAHDLMIVPGLAFDRNGWRLGYGGGFYDAYLAGHTVRTVGACFTEQVVPKVPHEAGDRRLAWVITSGGCYDCIC